MKYEVELSIVGACGGYSKTPAKHAPAVGNSVLNSSINNLGSGSTVCLFGSAMLPIIVTCSLTYTRRGRGGGGSMYQIATTAQGATH